MNSCISWEFHSTLLFNTPLPHQMAWNNFQGLFAADSRRILSFAFNADIDSSSSRTYFSIKKNIILYLWNSIHSILNWVLTLSFHNAIFNYSPFTFQTQLIFIDLINFVWITRPFYLPLSLALQRHIFIILERCILFFNTSSRLHYLFFKDECL